MSWTGSRKAGISWHAKMGYEHHLWWPILMSYKTSHRVFYSFERVNKKTQGEWVPIC